MSESTVPENLRNLRACLMCSLVKSFNQFESHGCDNCDRLATEMLTFSCQASQYNGRYLNMKHDSDRVYDCTGTNFDGLICLMQPEDSWVAKWQKLHRKCKGVYAVSVSGTLPPHVVDDLKSQGINYYPFQRDMTTK